MNQMFSPVWPDPQTMHVMLLVGAGIVAVLLAAALIMALFMTLLLPFVPWQRRGQLRRDGVEQFERLGFTTVARRR